LLSNRNNEIFQSNGNNKTRSVSKIFISIFCIFLSIFLKAQSISNQSIGSVANLKALDNSSITFSVGELILISTNSDEGSLSSGFFNGLMATTSIIPIEQATDFTAKIYPNPVFDLVTISVENKYSDIFSFEISDIQGKIVSKKKSGGYENLFSFDMSIYPKGTYFLKIRNNHNTDLASYKLIKK
tara:strand:+ start:864 stop:1418 length:555 start_codon:yes stop_codon:yes gene_type:complete